MLLLRALLGATIACAASGPAMAACMSDRSTAETAQGQLAIVSARDGAGRAEKVYILTLPAPTCLTTEDPEDGVKSTRTIHIFSTDAKVHASIAHFVGRTVVARGRTFPALTVHHHAPIIMDITEIDAR